MLNCLIIGQFRSVNLYFKVWKLLDILYPNWKNVKKMVHVNFKCSNKHLRLLLQLQNAFFFINRLLKMQIRIRFIFTFVCMYTQNSSTDSLAFPIVHGKVSAWASIFMSSFYKNLTFVKLVQSSRNFNMALWYTKIVLFL